MTRGPSKLRLAERAGSGESYETESDDESASESADVESGKAIEMRQINRQGSLTDRDFRGSDERNVDNHMKKKKKGKGLTSQTDGKDSNRSDQSQDVFGSNDRNQLM